MVDVNCPWTVWQALAMARDLEDLDLTWLEEPVWPPGDHEGLSRVRLEGGIPIAAGENAAGLHDFRAAFEAGAQDIAQPSVTKIGGPSAMVEVAALAKAFAVRLVPHNAYFGAGLPGLPPRQHRPRPRRAVRAPVRRSGGQSLPRHGGGEGRQGEGADRSRPRARSRHGGAATLSGAGANEVRGLATGMIYSRTGFATTCLRVTPA